MGHFACRNGAFCNAKKYPLKYKLLIFNMLRKPLIIRVFAPEGESVRKYALILWGIVENSDRKIENCLQIESCQYRFNLNR